MYNLREEAGALLELAFLLEHYDQLIHKPKQLGLILTEFRFAQKDLKHKFCFSNSALVLMARYFYEQEREKQNSDDPETIKKNARAALLKWVQSVADSVQKIMAESGQNTAKYQNGKNTVLSRNYIIPSYDKIIALDQAISDAVSAAPLPVYGADSYPTVNLNENGFVDSVTANKEGSQDNKNFWQAQLYHLCKLEAVSRKARHPDAQNKDANQMRNAKRVEATLMLMIWYAHKISEIKHNSNDIIMIPVTKAYLQKSLSQCLSADNSFKIWILDYQSVIKLIPAPDGENSYLIGIRFIDPKKITLPETNMELPDLRYFDYGIRAHSENNFFGITLSMLSEATTKMADYVLVSGYGTVHFKFRKRDDIIPEEKYGDLKKQIQQAIIVNTSQKWPTELRKTAYAFACQLIASGACKNSIFVCATRMQCFSCDESKFKQYQDDISEFESSGIEKNMPEHEK